VTKVTLKNQKTPDCSRPQFRHIMLKKTQHNAKAGTMLLEGRNMTKISIAIKVALSMLAVAILVFTHVSYGGYHSL
jgi:hypothetical protein